tara:strand:+ start:136 stop:372 length:237 start_codon:yes stop_codon:yes gene_type:complete
VEPITCCCCCLILLLLLGAGGGHSNTTNTIVIDRYGNQTVTTNTQKSMSIGDLIGWIIIGIIFVPVAAGVLYVWANSL